MLEAELVQPWSRPPCRHVISSRHHHIDVPPCRADPGTDVLDPMARQCHRNMVTHERSDLEGCGIPVTDLGLKTLVLHQCRRHHAPACQARVRSDRLRLCPSDTAWLMAIGRRWDASVVSRMPELAWLGGLAFVAPSAAATPRTVAAFRRLSLAARSVS